MLKLIFEIYKTDEERRILAIMLTVAGIIITIAGATLAYWNWQTNTSQKTMVNVTVTKDFECSVDGGGPITSTTYELAPTTCTDSTYAIKREVTVNPTINGNNPIDMEVWLDVKEMGSGLSNSQNFRYALTTNENSCTDGVIESGTFNGKTKNTTATILNKTYSTTTTETYWLYVWLDAAETSDSTMNQIFSLNFNGSCEGASATPEPNAPVLDTGMIPVTIANDGTVTTISSSDSSWYNYSEKQWANAVLVSESSRNNYLNTTGTTVQESDILAYYVWIPRYKYKIPEEVLCSTIENPSQDSHPECYAPYTVSDEDKTTMINWWQDYYSNNIEEITTEQATTDINSFLENGYLYIAAVDSTLSIVKLIDVINYYTGEDITYTGIFNGNANIIFLEKSIDIVFENKANKTIGDAVSTYYTHPAFTFGEQELDGFWVGKFETTGIGFSPKVLPNVSSQRSQNVSTQFQISLKFAGGTLSDGNVTFTDNPTYGLTTNTDSHMMKNSEWGAVAYLSYSIYGINTEIRINNNSNFITGCGASTANGSSTSECQIQYGNATEYPQSTTGNITGIYDMSGGAWEYVMGVYSDSSGNPRSGYSSSLNSGFNGVTYDSGNNTSYTSGIEFPSSKYYDLYLSSQFIEDESTNNNYCTLATCGGHALYETANWYSDYSDFVCLSYPWFTRGGHYSIGFGAGAFNLNPSYGYANKNYSWRSVLVVS